MPPTRAPAPPHLPVGPRARRGTYLFGGLYGLMLIAGFAVGFRAGSSKPTPARPILLAKATTATVRPEPTVPPPEPAPKAPEPKPAEPKEAGPMPMPEPPPEPKPQPKAEPKKSPPASAGPVIAFAQVAPVFKDKCTICHGGVEPKGGLDLRSAKAAIAGGDSGEAVKAGDPDNSLLWQSIAEGKMPPKKKPQLTADEKKLIRDWIAGGAK